MRKQDLQRQINWSYPTAIRFGQGRVSEVAEACASAGMRRPLLVADPFLAESPAVRQAQDRCRALLERCDVFAELQGNPVESDVNRGVDVFRSGDHDGVIAFGGGSALDVGKTIAFMSGQSRPMWDFEDREDWYMRADEDGIAPVIAVPTTSGTGSEVGRASVITDESDYTKKIIFHPKMMPVCVILDPELTVGLPANLTAGVGMDALSHNLEAYCSPVFHPIAQGIALEGIRIVHDWLPLACEDGTDIEARAQMQVASSMGATSFQKGLGAMHSLSHPCSSILGTHHGTTNAVVMPYVLEFNRDAIEDKLEALASYLGLAEQGVDAVIDWVVALKAQIGIPRTLAQLGVGSDHVERFSEMAMQDPPTLTNPVEMTRDKFEFLYEKCINGTL